MSRDFELKEVFNRFKTNPLHIFKLLKLFNNNEINIIHFQLSQHPIFILLLIYTAKFSGRNKIIITAHNVLSHESKSWEKGIYSKIYSYADRIIVHAHANKIDLLEKFKIDKDKVTVIPHGNYSFFNEKSTLTAAHPDSFNILFFGYIRKYKGLSYLIKALKLIKEKVPQAKLLIIGKPVEDFNEYEMEIHKLGLENNVEINLAYAGFDQINEYFNKANVVALPYLYTYQSGIVQLAYGFGRPVVASDVGGLKESIDDGKSGFLVPPRDSEALSEKIVAILMDRELQDKMGKYALFLAQTKFSWEAIAKQTLELCRSTINQK